MDLQQIWEQKGWAQPKYGYDLLDNPVVVEDGYKLLSPGVLILLGDKPFDVYSGWLETHNYHAKNEFYTESSGRWTAWERKI